MPKMDVLLFHDTLIFSDPLHSNGHGADHIENTFLQSLFYCCVCVFRGLHKNGSTCHNISIYYYCAMFGSLTSSEHQLYNVTPLSTPFRLLIPLLQSQPHVTTNTHNYSLRCVTFTQLTIIHVRDYNHLSHSCTFILADFSAINYFLRLSETLHLHTQKLSPRSYSANSPLKTAT
jgi:hypothetical protein